MNHTLAALMLEVLHNGESYLISDLATRLDCRAIELREIKNALQAQLLKAGLVDNKKAKKLIINRMLPMIKLITPCV